MTVVASAMECDGGCLGRYDVPLMTLMPGGRRLCMTCWSREMRTLVDRKFEAASEYGQRIPAHEDIVAIGAVMAGDHTGLTLSKDEIKKIRKALTAYLDQFKDVAE